MVVNKEEEEVEGGGWRGVRQSHQGQKLSLSFCVVVLCYDVPEFGHGRVGTQGGRKDNQDNVGNEEEVDTEEVDVEKVVTMGTRRRMRRWSTRSPRKNHFFFNMFLYF